MNSHLSFGYACLNTRLREEGIFCARTCRLDTLKANGVEFAQQLAVQNLKDVLPILEWNHQNDISLFRLSSDIFPLAAHPDCLYSMDFAQELLTQVGETAKKYGQRLTLHPSQHHVLSAKSDKVIHSTNLGLEQQCAVLDRMGLDKQSVMIIHGGGVYGNKTEALQRLETNILALDRNVRDRLVLENDEMAYNLEDLLPISQKLKIPIVVDFHHDSIYPSSLPVESYLPAVFQIWDERGIKPKVHVSESPPGINLKNKHERRKHGDYIETLPPALLSATRNIDVMFEAKMKEDAVLEYRGKHATVSCVEKPKAVPIPDMPKIAAPSVSVQNLVEKRVTRSQKRKLDGRVD